jgi:hypothetical protein
MSLINDALKKAQRMRTHEPAAAQPRAEGGADAKPGRTSHTHLLIGVVAGAAVLVAGSVLATVYLLRQHEPASSPIVVASTPSAAVAAAPTSAPAHAAPPTTMIPRETSRPAVVPTKEAPIVVVLPPPSKAPASESRPTGPTPVATPGSTPAAPPAAIPETPAAPSVGEHPVAPPAPATARPDPRAQTWVDTVRVTGIRPSGADSKVLMNERVYRVNDVVERALGLRLTEVAADRLTFTDANGIVYTRNF